MIRTLVVEDPSVTGARYRALFDQSPGLLLAGRAAGAERAVVTAAGLRPDAVLVDVRTHPADAEEIVRGLAQQPNGPPPTLVLVQEFDNRIHRLLELGARGLLSNRSTGQEILAAIRLIATGGALLLPSGEAPSISRPNTTETNIQSKPRVPTTLSPREADVLRLISRGLSNAEISEALSVSESTVKSHVQRLLKKLELRNRIHAVIYAYETGAVRAGHTNTTNSNTT